VTDKSRLQNSFEFVVVAGARARQLMKGALPRVENDGTPIRVAQAEVEAGKVNKIDPAARGLEP
jgi:DNA-directed RNA polymerase subunit K/omega